MGTMIEGFGLALPVAQTALAEIDLAGLVSAYSPLLFRVAHSVLRSPTEAEDVVQDVFVRVLEHRRTLPQVREVRVWLIRIAWNLALNRRRKIRPEQMDELFAAGLVSNTLPADQALLASQQMRAVLLEMERLPQQEKQALLLSALEELTTSEIAKVMRKSESAIRALLFRARSRLRERLDKLDRGGQ